MYTDSWQMLSKRVQSSSARLYVLVLHRGSLQSRLLLMSPSVLTASADLAVRGARLQNTGQQASSSRRHEDGTGVHRKQGVRACASVLTTTHTKTISIRTENCFSPLPSNIHPRGCHYFSVYHHSLVLSVTALHMHGIKRYVSPTLHL